MSFSTFFILLLHGSCYLIPVLVIIFLLKSPLCNGFLGEFAINTSITHSLNPNQYHLLKDITIPYEYGSTQLDHVIVSKFGVFVLEAKYVKGLIFGSECDKTWSQKFYESTTQFQNPLYENHKKVKILQQLLGLTHEQMHLLVVFVGDCTLKSTMPENVTKGKDYLKFIKSKTDEVLSEQEVTEIIGKIESGRLNAEFENAF
ncbi:MAG: NERD domain-containing protein [Gammaproteobacteria bacterium]|nr:NERD domain-containing protein [Gammaproteobacteria bacterium]